MFLKQQLGTKDPAATGRLGMLGITEKLLALTAVEKRRSLAGIYDLADLLGRHMALRLERSSEITRARATGAAVSTRSG